MSKLLEQLTLRVDEELVRRLETQARLIEQDSGVRVSRSEVARRVLLVGLGTLEIDVCEVGATARVDRNQ